MESNNLNALLKGRTLLLEIKSDDSEYRTWIELSLQNAMKPKHPFRTDNYAMISTSPYTNPCKLEDAAFKLRISKFLASDIENEYDPSYDGVGDYIFIESPEKLLEQLKLNNISLCDFVDSSKVEEYPL